MCILAQGPALLICSGPRATLIRHWLSLYTTYKCFLNVAHMLMLLLFETRAGFNWCEALGLSTCEAPSPIVARKKWKALINLRKSENDTLKVRSVKNSKSLLECPRSLICCCHRRKMFNDTELLKSYLAGGNRIINCHRQTNRNPHNWKNLTKHVVYVFL